MDRNNQVGPVRATFVTLAAFLIFYALRRGDALPIFVWPFAGLTLLGLLTLAKIVFAAFRWSRLLRIMAQPVGLYGRTAFPTSEDAEAVGLKFSNADGNGIPVGGVGNKIIYYDGPGHVSIRASTNAGKTESSAAPICYALGAHRNIIATAKGAELAMLCGPYRRDILKQSVIFIDPWRQMKPLGLPSHDFNPVGHFPRYVTTQSPEMIDKAFAASLILLPEALNASGENKIFRTLARELMSWCLMKLAIDEAESGVLCCNLPSLKAVLGGSNGDLQAFLQGMRACDLYEGSIRRAADRILAMIERSPKLAESVISEALAALTLYDIAGTLGRTTQYSDFDPRDLKNPQKATSLFVVVPAEKTALYGPHVGLCLNALIDICIEADRFEPRVTVVADEFAACGVLPSALPTLYLGRSRGVQLVTYVQDTESYARYGQEASAFTTQAECVIAWAVRSTKDAEEYSKRAGQRSVMTESTSIPWEYGKPATHSVSLSEKQIPYLRPDEFMQLPDYTAVLFYKQNPPLIVDLVSYRAVEGWRQHAKPMPGAPPLAPIPVKYSA